MVDQTAQLYKLAITPSGRRLWTYMAAILVVTEMDQGKPFPLKRFLKNFQASSGCRANRAGARRLQADLQRAGLFS